MFGRKSKELKITEAVSILCREILHEPLTAEQEAGLLRRLEQNRGILDISGLYKASRGVVKSWEGMREGARELRDNTERFLGVPLRMEVVQGGKPAGGQKGGGKDAVNRTGE